MWEILVEAQIERMGGDGSALGFQLYETQSWPWVQFVFLLKNYEVYGGHNLWHSNIAWHIFFLHLVFHFLGVN